MVKQDWEDLVYNTGIKSRLVDRSKLYNEATVPIKDVTSYEDKDWVTIKQTKRSHTMRKPKTSDELFEDSVWCALANMGFDCMNAGRDFRIKYTNSPLVEPQQIDVFAKDDHVALVIECKNYERDSQKSFKEEVLDKINARREHIDMEIIKKFEAELMTGYIVFTNNYTPSESDRTYAEESNIVLLNSHDVKYYTDLSKNIGASAKYQLLSDVFDNKSIPDLDVKIPAIKGDMGGNTFYSFLIEPYKLLPMTFVAHRIKNSKPTSTTYQRMIQKQRIEKIRNYIEHENGYFPNSVLINVKSGETPMLFEKVDSCVDSEVEIGVLHLPNKYKSAWIIDGQHRLFGYYGTESSETAIIPVAAFENLKSEVQSELFVNINSKQTNVKRNLILEINADLHIDSNDPEEWIEAVSTRTILEMSTDSISPLYGRLKRETEDSKGDLTVASMTRAMVSNHFFGSVENGTLLPGEFYNTKDPANTNSVKRGKTILNGYLTIFKNIAPDKWNTLKNKGGYLCTNNGITAELIVLREILRHIQSKTNDLLIKMDPQEIIDGIKILAEPLAEYFKNASEADIKRYKNYQGADGHSKASKDMMIEIQKSIPDFNPPDLEEYKDKIKAVWEEQTINLMPRVKKLVISTLIEALKEKYGDNWWRQSIPIDIQAEIAVLKVHDTNDLKTDEDFIALKHAYEIISTNWQSSGLSRLFGFAGQGKKKEDKIKWIKQLINIEELINNPYVKITKDDFTELKDIFYTLNSLLMSEDNNDSEISELNPQ